RLLSSSHSPAATSSSMESSAHCGRNPPVYQVLMFSTLVASSLPSLPACSTEGSVLLMIAVVIKSFLPAGRCGKVSAMLCGLQHVLLQKGKGVVLGDDDVVEQVDAHGLAGALDLLGKVDVLRRGFELTAGVVV